MTRTSRSAQSGFTLLEVILAITISALLVGLLYAALRLGYKSQEKGMVAAEASQRVRIAADRIAWLLAGAYPYKAPPGEEGEAERYLFKGESESLEFVTTSTDPYSGQWPDRVGLKAVRLYVDDGGLKAAERLFFLEDDKYEEVYVLEPGAKGMRVEYFDVPPEEEAGAGEGVSEETAMGEEGEWTEAWDTDSKPYLPSAVKVTLTLRAEDGSTMVMPPVTVALMAVGREGPGLRVPPITEVTEKGPK